VPGGSRKPLNFREADGRLGKLSGFYFSDIAALALERQKEAALTAAHQEQH
jgi:hypothetical protein